MANKTKTVQTKGSKKPTKPTPVKKPVKGKKTPVKKPKKAAPKKPVVTDKMLEKYFFSLSPKQFVKICEEWNEKNFKIKLPKYEDYDQWINYFRKVSPATLQILAGTGKNIISTEGYAALTRWHDIVSNPSRIDKIHQTGLTNSGKRTPEQDIVALAKNNDRMGVLMAVRDRIAEKLEKGAGARDTASLAKEMGDILDQIAELQRRQGPKAGTKLNSLLGEVQANTKRVTGGGARNTSFKARVTIDDTEGK